MLQVAARPNISFARDADAVVTFTFAVARLAEWNRARRASFVAAIA